MERTEADPNGREKRRRRGGRGENALLDFDGQLRAGLKKKVELSARKIWAGHVMCMSRDGITSPVIYGIYRRILCLLLFLTMAIYLSCDVQLHIIDSSKIINEHYYCYSHKMCISIPRINRTFFHNLMSLSHSDFKHPDWI